MLRMMIFHMELMKEMIFTSQSRNKGNSWSHRELKVLVQPALSQSKFLGSGLVKHC